MNYSENHNSMRNSILDNDNDAQYYHNQKKSNMPKRQPNLNQDNKSMPFSNSCQKSEGQSRLNYNSVPFTPKQPTQNSTDITHLISEVNNDSVQNMLTRMPPEHDGSYYQQGSNIGFDNFGGSIANQCMYNPMEFMQYLLPFPNNGSSSNYWPMVSNNSYFGVPNMSLSTTIEPNQNLFMIGKNSENSFSTNSNFNSTNINTNPQQLSQNNRQNPQVMKQNDSVNLNPEVPTPGLLWRDHLNDKNINQLSDINLNNHDFNNTLKSNFFDKITFNEILNSVSDLQIRKRLSETMQNINPQVLTLKNLSGCRFFVIKSYSEDDLHRAIKYGVWCSTKNGNKKLDDAYKELHNGKLPTSNVGRLFLFFSVNGSGFFAGIAEMISRVDFEEQCGFWSQNKWVGRLNIKWHYVKDVRNSSLRHIRSVANENKPVTNSRDAVEVTPNENGIEFIKVFHQAKHETSVFDDFEHYEQREKNPGAQ